MQEGPRSDLETRIGWSATLKQVRYIGLHTLEGLSREGSPFDGEDAAVGNG